MHFHRSPSIHPSIPPISFPSRCIVRLLILPTLLNLAHQHNPSYLPYLLLLISRYPSTLPKAANEIDSASIFSGTSKPSSSKSENSDARLDICGPRHRRRRCQPKRSSPIPPTIPTVVHSSPPRIARLGCFSLGSVIRTFCRRPPRRDRDRAIQVRAPVTGGLPLLLGIASTRLLLCRIASSKANLSTRRALPTSISSCH